MPNTRIVLVCPLRRELHEIRSYIGGEWVVEKKEGFTLYRNSTWEKTYSWYLYSALIGTDIKSIKQKIKNIIQYYSPDIIIELGYAGGLDPELMPGTMVISDTAYSHTAAQMINLCKCAALSEKESDNKVCLHASVLCTSAIINDDHQRRRLFEKYHTGIVTGETYTLAEQCMKNNIQCYSIRIITDSYGSDINHMHAAEFAELFINGISGLKDIINILANEIKVCKEANNNYGNKELL